MQQTLRQFSHCVGGEHFEPAGHAVDLDAFAAVTEGYMHEQQRTHEIFKLRFGTASKIQLEYQFSKNTFMKRINFKPFAFVAFYACALVHAQHATHNSSAVETTAHHTRAIPMTDEKSIEHVMKSLFDKPEAALNVGPVSIEGSFAVAGWSQNERGGRALLQKEKGYWSIQVCGGDGLKQASVLAMAGMGQSAADKLAQKVVAAEKQLSTDQVRQFALFEGVVKVELDVHHPQTAPHGHTGHSQ